MIIKINNKPYEIVHPKTGDATENKRSVQVIDAKNRDRGMNDLIQPTELGESLEHLNKDEVEPDKMTSIDMRGRLHHAEISSILALDSLVSIGVCPSALLSFTRRKKRLSVSVDGKGRTEVVHITTGKQENDRKKLGDYFTGMFKKKEV